VKRLIAVSFTLAVLGVALALTQTGGPSRAKAAPAAGQAQLTKFQRRIMSGFLAQELPAPGAYAPQHNAAPALSQHAAPSSSDEVPRGGAGCPATPGENRKISQNCLNITDPDLQGRGQAQNETAVAIDPGDPRHMIAAFNDYRRGDSTCGAEYSLDGGRKWGDATLPNGFVRGQPTWGARRQYHQASGDASLAWDTRGNAYYTCLEFNRGNGTTANPDQSSGVYVHRSTASLGAAWTFPGRPVIEAQSSNPVPLEDKPYMTVDAHAGSPFRDRVYVTWTEFAADGTAYIYASHSSDYGEHFTPKVLVSRTSGLCPSALGVPTPEGACNNNQFSSPVTAPDGTLYVAYSNYNTAPRSAGDNHDQVLLAKSSDGGATFSDPVKVADYYDLPDCASTQGGQNAGSACVPEK
jgi:hypothetical protein